MEVLNYNTSKVIGYNSNVGNVTTAALDWNDSTQEIISTRQYDLVIVSDCTYNADSIPALVNTLAEVSDRSPAAMIVVSMKIRHDSEAVFFDLMATAGFVTAEHTAVMLPDRLRADSGRGLDFIDIYIFDSNKDIGHS